ncbi:MAG TPA: class IV adenylate cyclase [Verrucomicrobiae bacterium]|jgi:adenylate cyclase, class 2|nr:class IV adenylate cyclase [Verrucomicrobiae bacterium]
MAKEIEIKFRVANLREINRKLKAAGFKLETRRTHEMNTLYDLPGEQLRKRNELLRIRKYGNEWKLTHKSGTIRGQHSSREELETKVENGQRVDAILRALGYEPTFRYEKFRAEWSDGKGEIVIDETPIGNFAELEGPPRWIDAIAKKLGIKRQDYITKNYATLFQEWKKETKGSANEMTFKANREKTAPN